MIIDIKWPWELSGRIRGPCVVLDINAATTNLAIILSKGVKKLLIANDTNIFSLKKKYKDAFIIGESRTLPNTLFNSSNLPGEIIKKKLKNKTVLYMSNNGSKVIEKLFKLGAKTVITAGFVNLQSAVIFLKEIKMESLILIPAGESVFPDRKSHEDLYCAKAIRSLLKKGMLNINYLNKAKRFVSSHYYPYMKDIEGNLQIEFALNRYPIVPVCKHNYNHEIIVTKV